MKRLGSGGALVSFLAGFMAGGLLVFIFINGKDGTTLAVKGETESDVKLEEDSGRSGELPPRQADASMPSKEQGSNEESSSLVVVAPENRPNTPPEYLEMLGPSYRSVSMEDLHLTFSLEPREEAWAFAVETEIQQYVANNNVAEWAEVEYVECRRSICEVAGYLHGDTTHDAREIIDGVSDATWWHQQRSSHQMRSDSGGLSRFLVIVTALNFENRTRSPRPVEQ